MIQSKNKLIKYKNPKFLAKYTNLDDIEKVKTYRDLQNKSGIYSFINLKDGMQYIGSTICFYTRMLQHVKGVPFKSNIRLQNAMNKHGRENFIFVIYEYAPCVNPDILELEDTYINNFDFDKLYNICKFASSTLGFRHSEETRAKMRERMLNPDYNPRLKGEDHPNFLKKGSLSPLWGKKISEETLALRDTLNIHPITLLDINRNYILTFKNKEQLSLFAGCSLSTVSRCQYSGKLISKKYYCKKD